jgi:4'-phosphopantetheinyl transferase
MAISEWPIPLQFVALDPNAVHIWLADLDKVAASWELLSEDEKARAHRFRFETDRRRFAAAHIVLRRLLAAHLGLQAEDIQFEYNEFGKPFLLENEADIQFNLSHAEKYALFALTRGRQIGVDIQEMRPNFSGIDVAEHFFSPREVAALKDLPPDVRCPAFFNCWTRKEAFVKARGEGLSMPLDQFDVSLLPGEPAALLNTSNDPDEASRWSMLALDPIAGYVAALAVEGRQWTPTFWRWPADL